MHPNFFNTMKNLFPQSFKTAEDNQYIKKELISPFHLELPQSILHQVRSFVNKIYQLKESAETNQSLNKEIFSHWPQNPSLLSCFDFHYSPDMGLKLIEINTNASLYITSFILYQAQNIPCLDEQLTQLYESFLLSLKLKKTTPVFIMDQEPEKQGLYFEFLLFKEWLEQQGHPAHILASKNFNSSIHKNIYNRDTDFYFANSVNLKQAYIEKEMTISPHPREYQLMADKNRLGVFRQLLLDSDPDFAEIIPETRSFADFESKEKLWEVRKKYFFKPSQSFGSKGVFSGKGISRKAFDSIYLPEFLAQELCPAGRQNFKKEDESIEMKYDLRFYTFEGEVQHSTARLYQGQATNMRTPNGGIAPIAFL